MCGILAICGLEPEVAQEMRGTAVALSGRLRHRGPDWSGCLVWDGAILVHERLSIIDLDTGSQPITNSKKTVALAINGEIYNYKSLQKQLKGSHQYSTSSDCECLIYLYEEYGTSFLDQVSIHGMFAFVIYDREKGMLMAARDHMGICPLYIGYSSDGSIWFASEMKALIDNCERFEHFPPGHIFTSNNHEIRPFYKPKWLADPDYLPAGTSELCLRTLRESLEHSVISHMMSDVPYGMLLSGGLDSSLVASIASKHLRQRNSHLTEVDHIRSFCIGLKDSPDLAAARKVADMIGINHSSWVFTVQEGLDALEEVIRHIETYDITTVRSSVPMYLLARRIKASGTKMVLSGEGADEIFGGYLYFHKAPNEAEFHQETVRKLKKLYQYDCLRANKSMMAWGVEVRVPFLDRNFLDFAMNINPKEKMIQKSDGRMEKYILRKAFDINDENGNPVYLPKEILWRQKEQFSDGVGYSWIDSLQEFAQETVSDYQMSTAEFRFPVNPPQSKEGYLIRDIFARHFPGEASERTVPSGPSIACSTPTAIKWDASFETCADPSGRALFGVHKDAYNA